MYHFRTSEYVPSDCEDADMPLDNPDAPWDDDDIYELHFETKAPTEHSTLSTLIHYVEPVEHVEVSYFQDLKDFVMDESFTAPVLLEGSYLSHQPLQMDKRTIIIELDKVLVDIVLED